MRKIQLRKKTIPIFEARQKEISEFKEQIRAPTTIKAPTPTIPKSPEEARLILLNTQIATQKRLVDSHTATIKKYQAIERTTEDRDTRIRSQIEQTNARKLLVRDANKFDSLNRERGLLIASGSLQEFALRESARQRGVLAESLAREPSARQIQIEKFRSEGLEPIFVKDILVGFGGEKVDIPISSLQFLPEEKLAALESKGLITFEPSTSQFISTSQLPPGSPFIKQEKQKFSVLGSLAMLFGEESLFGFEKSRLGLPSFSFTSGPSIVDIITGEKRKPDVTFAQIGGVLTTARIPPKIKKGIAEVLGTLTTPIFTGKEKRERRKLSVELGLTGTELLFRGVSEFIPTTTGGALVFIATPFAIGKAAQLIPRITKLGLIVGGGAFGLETLKPGLTPQERVTAGIGSLLFFGGAKGAKTKFQIGKKQQLKQIELLQEKGLIDKSLAKSLKEGVKLQKFFRGIEDVPVIKSPVEAFPKGLSVAEQEVFARVALEGKIFGSQATRLRGLRELGGDVDIAFKENIKVLESFKAEFESVSGKILIRRGEAIGIAGEPKAFDIKSLQRVEDFPFSQKGVRTPEAGEITRLSEQFSRALTGLGELRKGGKDIGEAIFSARGLVGREAGRLIQEEPTPFGLGFIEKFRLRRAEKRLAEFETALPGIEKLGARTGSEIPLIEDIFIPTAKAPTLLDVFPPGKRGRINIFGRETRGELIDPIIKLAPRKTPRGKFEVDARIKLEVSKIKPSKIKGSRFRTFVPLPSKIFSFAPSKIMTPIIDFKPSVFFQPIKQPKGKITPRQRPKPSRFPVPKITIPNIIITERKPIGFDFGPTPTKPRPRKPRRLSDEAKRKIRKRKLKIRQTPLAPSFTAIIAELEGKFPKTRFLGGREIGISPGELRLLPKRKRAKKGTRRKSRRTLTNI